MAVAPLRAKVRPPIVDGLFYPAKGEQLRSLVDQLLAASPTPERSCFAAVSPHASYEYAGATMASAFKSVSRRRARTVIVIGPVHRDPQGGFFLPESELFSTPIGAITVDVHAAEIILGHDPAFQRNDIFHLEEHCLEVQLPFIARVFPEASVVPILTGSRGSAAAATLAGALAAATAESPESTVIIVTSNAASYMTGKDTTGEAALLEDLAVKGDWRGLIQAEEKRRVSACGATALAAVLSLAGSSCRVEMLDKGSSRDMEQGPVRTVHYAAISIDDGVLPR